MQSSSAAYSCRGRTVNYRAAPRLRRLRAQKSTFAVIFIIQKQDPRRRHRPYRGAYHRQRRNGAFRYEDVHPPRPLAAERLPHGGQNQRGETDQRDARRVARVDTAQIRRDASARGSHHGRQTQKRHHGTRQNATTLLQVCDRFIEDYTNLLKTEQCCRKT